MSKFTLFSVVTGVMLGFMVVNAQETEKVYQIPNSGLDEWGKTANGKGDEPLSWHSFMSASGRYATFATNQLNQSTAVRPGGKGYSVKIWAKNILSKNANGNFTTGTINMGDMTPTSEKNYNFTDPEDPGKSCPFHGKPDSLKVWLNFKPINEADLGQVSAWIHDNYAFKDPHSTVEEINEHVVAHALVQPAKTDGWQEFTIPFDYTVGNCETPHFILVSITTNKTPGEGTGATDKGWVTKESPGDTLYIDDISLVYNSRLDSVYLDGEPFSEFNKEDYYYDNILKEDDRIPEVTSKADGAGAVCQIDTDEFNSQVTISVTAQDGSASHVYQLNFVASPNAVFDIAHQSVKVYVQQNKLCVKGNRLALPIEICDMQGRTVGVYSGSESVIYPRELIPGALYIVKVGAYRTKILF